MRPRKSVAFTLLAAILAATCAAAPVAADTRDPEAFPPRVRCATADLELCSTGLVRRLLMRALAAGLYLERCGAAGDVLADVPKALEISYFWPIAAADLARAGDDVLARSFTAAELAPVRDRIARLHAAYRDVQPGDRYRLAYVPGRGTELALNDTPLVVIPGADFASIYFSIWLGDRPADDALRAALLAPPRS